MDMMFERDTDARFFYAIANFSAFEVDEELLSNLREYALANSLYWALAEGHACEQSARRNAMDVSAHTDDVLKEFCCIGIWRLTCVRYRTPPRTLVT